MKVELGTVYKIQFKGFKDKYSTVFVGHFISAELVDGLTTYLVRKESTLVTFRIPGTALESLEEVTA